MKNRANIFIVMTQKIPSMDKKFYINTTKSNELSLILVIISQENNLS